MAVEFKDLKELWEALQEPAAQAYLLRLADLREQAMGELLESNDWQQFLETRAGIRVIDQLLELKQDIATEIVEAEDARRHDSGEYDN
jgi:hypothetical protein